MFDAHAPGRFLFNWLSCPLPPSVLLSPVSRINSEMSGLFVSAHNQYQLRISQMISAASAQIEAGDYPSAMV